MLMMLVRRSVYKLENRKKIKSKRHIHHERLSITCICLRTFARIYNKAMLEF
jgi:hypothetical protein